MYLQDDWHRRYDSGKALKKDLGIVLPYEGFKGWLENDTDIHLIVPDYYQRKEKQGGRWLEGYVYIVYCWNNPSVRMDIAAFLGLPVHRVPNPKKGKKRGNPKVRK